MKTDLKTVILSSVICILLLSLYHHIQKSQVEEIEKGFARLVSEKNNEAIYNRSAFNSPEDSDIFIEAASYARRAVASIKAVKVKGSSVLKDSYTRTNGSAVVIDPEGYIVTNYHVVEDADIIECTLEDKREFEARVLGFDKATDLALLKIDAQALDFLKFGDSNELKVGEWVLAVGNPFKLQSSVTAGIVSAKARNINIFDRQGIESFIQTDAVINPGNSGGALIDTDGYLIGINTAILSLSGKYEGFSFAIPSNIAKKVIDDIRSYGAVQRAWLGVAVLDVNHEKAQALKLDFVGGALVDIVDKLGAGKEAGLKSGDVIVSINDRPTLSVANFLETVSQFSPGDNVNITYYRNGEEEETRAELKNQINSTDFVAVRSDKLLTDLGFELRNLDSAEKSRLNTQGIMVVSVIQGSKISTTNMDPGYIITELNGENISSVDQFVEYLSNYQGRIELKGFYENWPGDYPYVFTFQE